MANNKVERRLSLTLIVRLWEVERSGVARLKDLRKSKFTFEMEFN
jgi:hypothetical protein